MLPRLASVVLLAMFASSLAQTSDAPRDAAWETHVELQVITLPAKDALALLPELSDEKSMPASWAKLQTMIASDKAKVSAVLVGKTHGEKIEVHQGEEVRYGSEFSQPSPIENPQGTTSGPKPNLGVSLGPTAFEIREIGVMLTADARASADGKHIILTATLEHVWMLGWQEFEHARLTNNEKLTIKMPRFATVKTTGTFALRSGERTLLSVHPVPGSESTMELFILRAWATPREAGGK